MIECLVCLQWATGGEDSSAGDDPWYFATQWSFSSTRQLALFFLCSLRHCFGETT